MSSTPAPLQDAAVIVIGDAEDVSMEDARDERASREAREAHARREAHRARSQAHHAMRIRRDEVIFLLIL